MTDIVGTSALVDIESIKQLKARYFRLLDTKRWDEWGLVFTDDVVMEVPEVEMVNLGRDEVLQKVRAGLEGAHTVHHGHMPEIFLEGPDVARGVWAMSDYVEWPSTDGGRVGLRGYGHYIEEYRRHEGQWQISKIRLERLRVDTLETT